MRSNLIAQIEAEPLRAAPGDAWPVEALLYTQLPFGETLSMQRAFAERMGSGEAAHHRLMLLEHPPTLRVDPDDDEMAIDAAACVEHEVEMVDWLAPLEPAAHFIGPGMPALHITLSEAQWAGPPAVTSADNDSNSAPASNSPATFALALQRIALATLAEFGIEAEIGDDGESLTVSNGALAGRTIGFCETRLGDGTLTGLLALHMNTDTALIEALGLSEAVQSITTMADLGVAPQRQDEVREALLRHAESVLGLKFHLPQRTELHAARTAKPPWLKARAPFGPGTERVREIIGEGKLHTVCESARCPNLGECWKMGTATFMINGDVCTRSCSFCAVLTGRPLKMDTDEPRRVAEAAVRMALKYVVVTAVNRDELTDGGAVTFVGTIRALREAIPGVRIETLIPDFKGNDEALDGVFAARPDVLNHNIETVPRLYHRVRPQAKYQRSLDVLQRAARAGLPTKSGIMLGLGEEEAEIDQTLQDLRAHGVGIVTIGQYLRPSEKHHPVVRYVTPAEFTHWRERGKALGFTTVESGPLVRSSYHAHDSFESHAAANEQQ